MSLYISSYESPIGKLTMLSNGQSLCYLGVTIPQIAHNAIQENNLAIFAETKSWLDTYFTGEKPDFTPQIEHHGTDFQRKIWHELMNIDYGFTATYGEIAKHVGCKSAQAVGQAIGRNPILIIIPCHRIVAAHGKLGGYSAGIERKIWLLENENKHSIIHYKLSF